MENANDFEKYSGKSCLVCGSKLVLACVGDKRIDNTLYKIILSEISVSDIETFLDIFFMIFNLLNCFTSTFRTEAYLIVYLSCKRKLWHHSIFHSSIIQNFHFYVYINCATFKNYNFPIFKFRELLYELDNLSDIKEQGDEIIILGKAEMIYDILQKLIAMNVAYDITLTYKSYHPIVTC